MHNLIFFIDFDKDLKYFETEFPLLEKMNYDFSYLKYIIPNYKSFSKKNIFEYFKENKKDIIQKLQKRKIFAIKSWNSINDNFFTQIKNLTQQKWEFEEYNCHLSSTLAGRYYLSKNRIVVFAFFKQKGLIECIIEELLHLHFWYCLKKLGVKLSKETISKYWDLSECFIDIIFPELKLGYKFSENVCTHTEKLHKRLLPIWKNRTSFDIFLKESLKIASKFKKSKESVIAAEFE